MINRERLEHQPEIQEREIVPGVWLGKEEREGAYVEIRLPEAEMTEVLERCEREFTSYATDLCWMSARSNGNPNEQSPFDQPLVQGIFNTLVSCAVLAKQLPDTEPVDLGPCLENVFRLALKNRFRLAPQEFPD